MPLFDEINEENKVRLTLTTYALSTVESDADIFELGKATLINRIIKEFAGDASCSISMRLMDYEKELTDALGEDDPSIDTLLSAREKKLLSDLPKYPAPLSPLIFRINKENLSLLTEDPSSREDEYYKKGLTQYVQALTEEFTRLSFVERERYYYNHIAEDLLLAKERGNAVWITQPSGNRICVRVYGIMTDPLSLYNYVVAAGTDIKNKGDSEKTFSFRLSRIKSVKENKLQSGEFTEGELSRIDSAIKTKGVQFMSSGSRFIKVWLSDDGIKMYNKILHMRPEYVRIQSDNHTYVFDCTPTQIEFYFLRFGANARVKAPKYLADRFRKSYEKAARLYEKAEGSKP